MTEQKKEDINWAKVVKWQDLFNLAHRNIKKKNFDVGRRVFEGYGTAFNEYTKSIGRNNPPNIIGIGYPGKYMPDAMSYCCRRTGQFEKAATRYEEIGAYVSAAVCFERIGNTAKAKKYFQQYIEAYPHHGSPYMDQSPHYLNVAKRGLSRLAALEQAKCIESTLAR
jgi:hypothetical protein